MSRQRPLRGKVCAGPLVPFEGTVRQAMGTMGYAPYTMDRAIRAMARLSEWMLHNGVCAEALNPSEIERFLDSRRQRAVEQAACAGVRRVIKILRSSGAIPEPAPDTSAVGFLLQEFGVYLMRERGLQAVSAGHYVNRAKRFLAHVSDPVADRLAQLDTATVMSIIVTELSDTTGAASAKGFTTAVRSLLRYLHVAGIVPGPLAQAVPARAGWRLSGVPRAVEPQRIETLLASTARSATTTGIRDHALLMLLARLGLRAREAATLSLDDIDWRRGEILVHGKGSTLDQLPMPVEVGEALATYLARARPSCATRSLIVTARPPYAAMSASCVRHVVFRACRRAAVPHVSAHQLRHTLATRVLLAGAGLAEIGQLLRHRTEEATAIYTKVDYVALRTLARPWPAGA